MTQVQDEATHTVENSISTSHHLFLEVPLGPAAEGGAVLRQDSTPKVICPKCYLYQEKSSHCIRCKRPLLGKWNDAPASKLSLPERLRPKPRVRRILDQPQVRRPQAGSTKEPVSLVLQFYLVMGIILGCAVSVFFSLTFLLPENMLLFTAEIPGWLRSVIQLHTLVCVGVWFKRSR